MSNKETSRGVAAVGEHKIDLFPIIISAPIQPTQKAA